MRMFWESTTAQFAVLILLVAAFAAGTKVDPSFGWLQWAELAKYALMTYAAKEGVKYGAEAYKG